MYRGWFLTKSTGYVGGDGLRLNKNEAIKSRRSPSRALTGDLGYFNMLKYIEIIYIIYS
jgi:hypothetical protein